MIDWSKVKEKLPLYFYGALTIGGMLFIMTAKTLEWSAWVTTIIPILLMLSYFLACLGTLKGLRLHNEQAGDNLYYMGFLFTLTSLGVSLYRFSAGASVDDIVQNFGVAVSSTIVGVTLRIFFNQMRRDPLDVDRTLRHELTEMTRRVKTELNSSAREFSSYRRISNQMLSEGFEEIARQAERNGEAILKSIEAMTKDAVRPIREAAERLSVIVETNNRIVDERARANVDMAEAALARLDATANRLAEIVGDFGNQVETAGSRLSGMRLPEDVLKVELQPVLASITELGDLQARRLEETSQQNSMQAERLKEAIAPLLAMPERIENAFRPLGDFSTSLGQSLRPLNDLPSRLETSLKAVDGLGEKIDVALKPLAKTAGRIDQSIGLLDAAAKQVGESAKTAVKVDQSVVLLEEAAKRLDESAKTLPIYGATVGQQQVEQELPRHEDALLNTVPPKGEDSIQLNGVLHDRPSLTGSYANGEIITEPPAPVLEEDTLQASDSEARRWWKW